MADIFPLQRDVNRKAALHVYKWGKVGTAFRYFGGPGGHQLDFATRSSFFCFAA